jgi:hypothetical protein
VNRDDIVDLLSTIAVGDRRTVGQTDVEFWYQILSDQPKDLAMEAVVDHFRESPGVWLEPGHIATRVRAMRRDMADREDDEQRMYRQDTQSAKAAADFTAEIISHRAAPVKSTPRLDAARERLQTCHGRAECQPAIIEYHAALREASGRKPKQKKQILRKGKRRV